MDFKKKAFKGLFFIGILALIIQGFTTIAPLPKDDFIGLQLYSVRQDMNKDAKGTVEKVGKQQHHEHEQHAAAERGHGRDRDHRQDQKKGQPQHQPFVGVAVGGHRGLIVYEVVGRPKGGG